MKRSRYIIIVLAILLICAMMFASCSSSGKGDSSTQPAPGESIVDNEKYIKTASVTSETKDFDAAITELKALIKTYESKIYSSNSTVQASYYNTGNVERRANYVLRVPSDRLEDFLDAINGFLNVTYVTTTTENVTEEYTDLKSRVDYLEEVYKDLIEELTGLDPVSDAARINSINSELNSIDNQLASLKKQQSVIDYSTVNISVTEVGDLTATEEKSYGQELWEAIKGSFRAIGEFLKGLIIFLIYIIPFAIIIGGIIILIVCIVKKANKKKAEREAANPKPNPAPMNYQQQPQFYGYGSYTQNQPPQSIPQPVQNPPQPAQNAKNPNDK